MSFKEPSSRGSSRNSSGASSSAGSIGGTSNSFEPSCEITFQDVRFRHPLIEIQPLMN